MSRKSAQRVKTEDELLEEFMAEQKQKRKDMVKRVLVILLCIFLVFAFCMPAVSLLMV